MSKKVKRLAAGFRPDNYKLSLAPDITTMKVKGSVVITGQKIGRPSQRITLHQHDIVVTNAKVTKIDKNNEFAVSISRIAHHKSYDEVRLHGDEMMYPGKYRIELEFEAKIQDSMHGIYVSNFEIDGAKKTLVSTQFESHHAREAFPCIDEPEAKATFDLTLVSPADEVALGNMPAATQSEENGLLITTFETTPKMSTYLLAFIYGDLQNKSAKTKGGVDVRVWATKAQPTDALDFALDVAVRGIEFYIDYYDTPYPLSKCDHVAIPDFSSGAMENWGLITYRETCLLADPATASQSNRERIATVVCHELSHQWFGNLVTMKWWDDLWLNESFANVMEYVATDALFPDWHIWNDFVTQEGLSALRRDAIAGVQAVRTEVRHPDEIATLFDPSIVYAKGGRILNMLMNYVGVEDFRKGLKAYFAKHAYTNTSGDDLWAALSKASGKHISEFMTPWLIQSGYPVIKVAQKGRSLDLSQQHFLTDPAKADNRLWPVPLLDGDDLPSEFSDKSTSVELSEAEYIRLNKGAIGHYLVHYTEAKHNDAISKLVRDKSLDIADRLMLLNSSSQLSLAGHTAFADTLRLLENYTAEDSEPVWDIMSLVIGDARRFASYEPELEDSIKVLIRELIEDQHIKLGWEEKPNEPSQDTKLRATIIGLGVYSEHEAITKRAIELFESFKQDHKSVPSELRGIIFSAAVKHKAAGAFEYLLELDGTTTNVNLKQDVLNGLTTTSDNSQIEMLLERIKDADAVRKQDVDYWLVSLLRNRFAQDQAWSWLRSEWGWIAEAFRGDKSYDNLPRYAASALNTRARLQEYKDFFVPLSDQPALSRNITIGIEELENRVKWLERDGAAVLEYFKSRSR